MHGSELSRRAVHIAVQVAKSLGAKLTAFHSIASYSLPIGDGMTVYAEAFLPNDDESAKGYASEILASIQAEGKGSGVECAVLVVSAAAPWDAIIKAGRVEQVRPHRDGLTRPQGACRTAARQRDHEGPHPLHHSGHGVPVKSLRRRETMLALARPSSELVPPKTLRRQSATRSRAS